MSGKIAIVYFTINGTTQQLAQHIRQGANDSGASAELFEIVGSDIIQGRYTNDALISALQNFDAIVFGSPTYMGSASGQFKAFMDATSDAYVSLDWRNKLAAGFTMGGSINGEQQQTLLGFFTLASQHAMLWVGLDVSKHNDNLNLNRTGSSYGLVATYDECEQAVHPNDLKTAYYLGSRIAQCLSWYTPPC